MGLVTELKSRTGGFTRVQFIDNTTSSAVITFDASIKEAHKRESPPTEFPIEDGTVISDHVLVKPFSLEMTGIISDTPLGGNSGLLKEVAATVVSAVIPPVGLAGAAALTLYSALSKSNSPSVAAYGQLLLMQERAARFDVITSLYRYTDMFIKSISVPRESDTGKILLFTLELVQLIIVSPQTVNVQIFKNPDLSANKADTGQSDPAVANAAKAGHAQEVATVRPLVRGP